MRDDGRPVPYDGAGGLAEVLARLEGRGFTATREDGHIIALARGGDRITVEPGGQLELSGGALLTATACAAALDAHVARGGRGGPTARHPFHRHRGAALRRDRRHRLAAQAPLRGHARLLPPVRPREPARAPDDEADGDGAGELRLRDEDDAVDKIRTAFGVTSIVTALYAASPIADGRPNGYKS